MSQTTLTNGTIPREVNNNTSKALTPGQLPSSAFPLKKFIALPQKGFKIKSGGDQESTTPRKPVPIKAIALPAGLPYCNGEVIEDLTEANNERVQAEHDRLSVGSDSPYIHHRRQPSVSSVASSLDGSVNSFESDGSARRSGRYRKRSSSTPPDIGRQRTSPVDKRIGRLANQYYQTVLNNNKNKNFNVNSGNLSQVNYSRHSNSSDTGISSADTDSDLFDFGDLDDVDLDDIVEPRYSSTPTGLNSSQPVSMTSQFKAVPSGHPTMMQPHYLTLPRNTRLNSETGSLHKADPAIRPTMAYVNGTLPRNGGHHGPALSVYRPRNDQQFIMMGTYPDSVGTLPRNYHGVTDSHNVPDNVVLQPQSSLYKSKAMSASMPTLMGEVSDKEHKKFLKQVKKFEKEEQKRREKEEKRRLKLEKKREKEIKRQEKKYGRTLPRSWGYVNKPIESVYRRPQLSLSAVPIDYEDGAVSSGPPSVRSDGTTITHRTAPPPNSPPPPPQPSVKTRSLYSSAPDLLRLEQVYGGSLRGPPLECNNNNTRKYAAPQNVRHVFHDSIHVSEFAPRSVVLQKGPEGYGFVLRGAKSQTRNTAELDFRPSAEFPALQYLDSVDPGSRSDRAGLKSGDFILEINGENVVRASHDRVVQLIRQSGDTLALKVVTVKPLEKPQHWLQHHDGTMTLPNRSTKKTGKAAPLPPQRDPHTSLSFTKAQGRQIADGMAELEQNGKEISLSTDHLDMVLADYDQHGEQMSISSDQKTASIRSKHSAKRVSCVELEKIENPDAKTSTSTKGKAPAPQPKDYMSPSEMRIKKYHKGKQNGLERSSSTPNLLEGGKKPEPVYATPQIPGDYRRSSNGAINNVYAVPGERPKAPPPPPPGGSSTPTPKRPAPAPPKDSGQVQNVKSEYVSISTERRNSSHTNLNEMSKADKRASEYESSFRPGISAKLTDEPKVQTSSLQQNKLSNRTHSRETSQISVQSNDSAGSKNSEDKPSVSFAEDKVYDSAKSFLQKHPNAHLLVTAEVHDKKSERKPSEPEPDYDAESDDGKNSKLRNSVTIISVGDNNNAKKLTVKSNIPPAEGSIVIPPPPSERAPEPPKPASKPTSGNTTPSQHSRQSSASENSEPSKIPPAPPVPPPPPAPPAPPPPPSTGMNSEKTPPLVSENKPKKPLGGLPTNDILAAVEKRKNRMESDGPKMSAGPNKDVQPRNSTEVRNKLIENTQAAILQAVAKRRAKLEQTSETEVADQIESKLSKTKKLQSSKMYFTSDTIQKLDKQEEKKEVKDNKKTEVKSGAIFSSDSISKTKPPSPVASKKTSAVTKPPSPVVEKKVKPPSPVPSKKTKPPSPVVMRKKEASPKKTDIGKGWTEETKVINPKVTDTSKDQNVKVNGDVNGEDFVAMAEKARQDWIKKRSSSSLLLKNKPEIKSKSGDTSKSQTSPKKTSLENKDTPKTNGVMIDSASAKNSKDSPYKKSSAPSSPSKISENKKEIKGITALKSARDTVILAKSTSIRARIANFEQGSKVSEGGKPNPSLDSKVPVYGVTVDSTATETPKSTLPPPPEFGDSVQLEIIPPPTGFNVAEGPDSPSYSAFHHDDSSSVSTLSTLSDDALDGRPKHGYEDLIAPPPPGFDDDSESCDVTNFIPPPPNFGGNVTKNKVNSVSTTSGLNKPFESKSVTSWQCLDVLDWLDSLGLGQYKISFQQKCIDGKKLASLTRNDYMQLGVTQVGHRMNLERSIKKVSARKFHS